MKGKYVKKKIRKHKNINILNGILFIVYSFIYIAFYLIIIGLIFLVIYKAIINKNDYNIKRIRITGFEWEQSIVIEEYKKIKECSWSLPKDVTLINSEEEIYSYSHDDLSGKDNPILKSKYYYEYNKWVFKANLKTHGFDQNPYWYNTSNLEDNQRVQRKYGNYYVIGVNERGKEVKVKLSYENWIQLRIGQSVNYKQAIIGEGKIVMDG